MNNFDAKQEIIKLTNSLGFLSMDVEKTYLNIMNSHIELDKKVRLLDQKLNLLIHNLYDIYDVRTRSFHKKNKKSK